MCGTVSTTRNNLAPESGVPSASPRRVLFAGHVEEQDLSGEIAVWNSDDKKAVSRSDVLDQIRSGHGVPS